MKQILCLLVVVISFATNIQAQTKEKVINDVDKLLAKAIGSKYSDGEMKLEITAQEFKTNGVTVSEKVTENGETITEKMQYYNFSWKDFIKVEINEVEGNSSLKIVDIYFNGFDFKVSTTKSNSDPRISNTTDITVYVQKKDVDALKGHLKKLKELSNGE